MHLGTNNPRHQYTLGRVPLKAVDFESDLGVPIDQDLKFHLHTAKVAKKCKYLLSVIRKNFTCHNRRLITKLYKAVVRPVIEYGNSVWGPFYKGDRVMLEKIQRKATRLVPDLRQLPYTERLKELHIPTLEYRRIRGDLIMTYKLVTGKTEADEGFMEVERRQHQTRGHSLRLKKTLSRKQVRRNHLLVRAVNSWNSLPEFVVNSETTTSFKNLLDEALKQKMFDID